MEEICKMYLRYLGIEPSVEKTIWKKVKKNLKDMGFFEALRDAVDEVLHIQLGLLPYIHDDYVIQPVQNAFNKKISYWISKKGYTISLYCFSSEKQESYEVIDKESDGYIRLFEEKCCLIEPAEFVSIWDDGNTEISCPCTVDLLSREITQIDFQNRKVTSADEEITNENVDDMVEILDREEICIHGKLYTAKQEEDAGETDFWYE